MFIRKREESHMRSLIIMIFAAMVSVMWLQAEGTAVYFADASLKAVVEAELGITDPTDTEMLGLTNLSATELGIVDQPVLSML